MSNKKNDASTAAAEQMLDMIDRRKLLRTGLAAGAAGAALPLLGAAVPASASTRKRAPAHGFTQVFDVAMLGDTFSLIPGPNVNNFDLRGTTFYVEGPIYPGYTIPNEQTTWDPSQHTSEEIGRWFDIGSFMSYPGRPNPHLYGTQTHIFGLITAENNFPPDQVSSIGTESSATQDTNPSIRSIVGGAGRYLGASGQITQFGNGTNVTFTNVLGISRPAPNFRFFFEFVQNQQ
ncbi:MAG TPA: hypothetical protein VKS82_10860 [Streptosporangiaceae bacterium]|jgi:hypothetical protein|nr:hypothetical protein [Streptosporangiaceae bacterium]